MALAEGVPAGDERDGLFVVHGHACKGLANVTAGGDRIRVAVRAFRVHVDQAHLHGGQRIFEIPVAAVALVARSQPLALGAPVNVLFRLPDVLAAAAEAEGLEAHGLEGAVAGEDHQVGPGDFLPYFCLIGQSRRRALSRFTLSGQLLRGAKRWLPVPPPPRPSPMR
jgi:hypothetical protein